MVVLGMLRWKCPPLLILVVLLIRWNNLLKHSVDPFACISNFHFSCIIIHRSLENIYGQHEDSESSDQIKFTEH